MTFYGLQSRSTYFRNNFTFINASKQSPKYNQLMVQIILDIILQLILLILIMMMEYPNKGGILALLLSQIFTDGLINSSTDSH